MFGRIREEPNGPTYQTRARNSARTAGISSVTDVAAARAALHAGQDSVAHTIAEQSRRAFYTAAQAAANILARAVAQRAVEIAPDGGAIIAAG